MKITRITCDGCGHDVTSTGNIVDYRLALVVEVKSKLGGAETLMGVDPPLKEDKHFCGLDCLTHWDNRRRYISSKWSEFIEIWKVEKGTKNEMGFSYPSISNELKKEKMKEFADEALKVFPLKLTGAT